MAIRTNKFIIAQPGSIFLRPELDDLTFISTRALKTGIAGVIVRPCHLHTLERDGADRAARVSSFRRLLGTPQLTSLFDPDTAALCGADILSEDGAERIRATPIAGAIDIPWTLDALADPVTQQLVLETVWGEGAFAAALTAPYVRVTRNDEASLALNLELVRRTAQAAAALGKPTCAILEANVGAITMGWLSGAPRRLLAAGAEVVLLRVVGLDQSSARHAKACLRFVRALQTADLEVICDQVGRAGPLLVAGTGCSASTGSWHHRSVRTRLVPRSEGGGGSRKIAYELPGRWRDAAPELARALPNAACAVTTCRALASDAKPADQREHFLHWMVEAAQAAAADGGLERILASLRSAGGDLSTAWVQALADAQAGTG